MDWKRFYSLRVKLLLLLLQSAVASLILVYLCRQLLQWLLIYNLLVWPLPWIINHIGSYPVMITAGIIVFVVMFFLFARGLTRYLKEIEVALHEIRSGQLDVTLPVNASDELSAVAAGINRMASELRVYLVEIRDGLDKIAEGRFDSPIPVRDGELAEVADSINKMAARLSRSIEEERNAEKSKNDLITGVSHDLRTPLTSILGFLEVIEEDRYRDETELRHYVNIAYEKAQSLRKLIDDLFEYTRVNNGYPIRPVELDLVGFLRQLAEEFVPSAERAGVVLRITAKVDRVIVWADGDLLVRSFENLLSNSIRYGADGKQVVIAIAEEEGEAIVRFVNYGEPIPNSDLQFIFDRFYRVEQSRSKVTGGTGLGLAIVKSIIEAHGGRISAMSDMWQTVFEARFPLAG
ncbi:sensor histidine kinase [Paenibacillus sacheonensis]|uniref:histidine kinase n=1 Tax=Paenibacillus sacheonensis TaxID=742054 RepID=A0A7X4YLE0_9BACL|nr:HAMP domain-containing sensor histidine kinase [Paenibacillus sacheonensis]MBM7568735.1 signal transduction histidine kinase [Paenibacillus sacheonensis]NBC68427.1 HAMP domain-containing protein [Paenibacillus sacheonensis]